MGAMSKDEINSTLFDEVKRLKLVIIEKDEQLNMWEKRHEIQARMTAEEATKRDIVIGNLQKHNNILEQHNNILFLTIKKIIEDFENTPLDENGTHRLIVGNDVLVGLKETLINVGYEF